MTGAPGDPNMAVSRRGRRRNAAVVGIALVALAGIVWSLSSPRRTTAPPLVFADAEDAGQVARGAAIYAAQCAACHGRSLEGQPEWWRPGADGRLPAPPQNETGHGWMHSDEELFRIVKFSVIDTAPPGYVSNMPSFDGALSDGGILAVLAFIKSRWPLGVRAYQSVLNPGNRGMPTALVGTDWELPKNCGFEPGRVRPSGKSP